MKDLETALTKRSLSAAWDSAKISNLTWLITLARASSMELMVVIMKDRRFEGMGCEFWTRPHSI
jgi:hypothetical protein